MCVENYIQCMETIYRNCYNLYSKPISGRKILFVHKPIVQAAMEHDQQNPRRSMRKAASQLGIPRSSMRRIYKKDIRLTAYKTQSRQLLSAASYWLKTLKSIRYKFHNIIQVYVVLIVRFFLQNTIFSRRNKMERGRGGKRSTLNRHTALRRKPCDANPKEGG